MVATFKQSEFTEDIFDYRPGESAVWICPTGGGKSHMMYRCVEAALNQNPHLHANTLMPKPADETTDEWAAKLHFKVTHEYPYRRTLLEKAFSPEPRGHVFWPRHIQDDEDLNQEHLKQQFKRALSGEYWRGKNITCVDDAYLIAAQMKLGNYTDKFLTAGRSNKSGLFGTLQQPRGTVSGGSVSSFWYSQPTHLFLGKDGVKANRERFSEIACGLDPDYIGSLVANLRTYRVKDSAVSDFLYLDRRGPYLAVVTPW